jgi:murein DD-endopeptidase MepM/ murein hydrolase activator NlpD
MPGRPSSSRLRVPRAFYTILILPHARSRFRKLHLSRGFLMSMAALCGLTMLAGLFSPHLWFRIQSQSARIEALAKENDDLQRQKTYFENAMAQLSGRLEGFESQATQLAGALGIGEIPSARPAAGGPGPQSGRSRWFLDDEFEALDGRASNLESSFEQIGRAFEERLRLLSSTPSILPTPGWFSHGYGWRSDPFTGRPQFHRGVDIAADTGARVVATADGVVSRAVRVSDYGKMVDVSHGYGFVTRYAHLDEILVRPGQRVHRGETIGRVGSTGRSTGPHVHYEVFRDGRRVNPWKYLAPRA